MTFAGDLEFRTPFIVNQCINDFAFHLDTKGISNILLNLQATCFRFLPVRFAGDTGRRVSAFNTLAWIFAKVLSGLQHSR